jgi:hypothetical protein
MFKAMKKVLFSSIVSILLIQLLSTPPASASPMEDLRAAMDLQAMFGRLNLQLVFTTALEDVKEAMGQSAKGRGEAAKQQV